MYYMNIHDIDAMRWSLDSEIERVSAVERRGELADIDVPDAMHAILEFENGATGVLEGYGTLPDSTPGGIVAGLDVTGTAGRVSVDTPGSMLEVAGESYDRPDTRHWPIVHGRMDGCVRRQIDWFAKAIDGEERMLADLHDAYRAQTVGQAIEDAAETGAVRSVDY